MPVVHCREVTGREGSQDMRTSKRYVRRFQLLTDSPADGVKTVRDFADLPNYGDQWEQIGPDGVTVVDTDPDARCVEKTATQTDGDNPQNWFAECRYVGLGDPIAAPPEVSWVEEKYQVTESFDETEPNPLDVMNTAGDPFESGLARDRSRLVLTIRKNVLTFDPLVARQFIDTTNAVVFLDVRHPPGFAVGLCKLDSLGAEAVYFENFPNTTDIYYWRQTAKISIAADTWDAIVLDAGFHEIVTVGGVDERKEIMLRGKSPTTPQPLDGSGARLPVGAQPVYLTFKRHKSRDWTGLALDY